MYMYYILRNLIIFSVPSLIVIIINLVVLLSVREENPRALASGLSPVQTHEPYSN